MPRPGKVTLASDEPTVSQEATRTQPGSLPNNKLVIKGTGTHADPYIGLFCHDESNYNATTISLPLMRESGDYAWMRIKKVHIYHAGTIGVSIWLGGGIVETDGSTGPGELPLGRIITTTAAEDVLEWDFGPDGVLLWRSAAPYTAVSAPAGSWSGELALEITNYAATDDLTVYVECEWAVRE